MAALAATITTFAFVRPARAVFTCAAGSMDGCSGLLGGIGGTTCGGGCGTCTAYSGTTCYCKANGATTCGAAASTCNPGGKCSVTGTGAGICGVAGSYPGSSTECDADGNPCTDDRCNGAGGCGIGGTDYTGSCSSKASECNAIKAPWCTRSGGLILCNDAFKPDGTSCSIGHCKGGTCVKDGPPPPVDSGGPPPSDTGAPPADTGPASGDAGSTDGSLGDATDDIAPIFPLDDASDNPDVRRDRAVDSTASPAGCGCTLPGAPSNLPGATALALVAAVATILQRRR